jgi:transcriptional regulator with XRE-family HTH domain
MGVDVAGSTIPRRTLGIALRQARAQAEVTMQAAAEEIGTSTATIRRMERGEVSSKIANVTLLCNLYGIDDKMRAVLIALAKESRAKAQWWHAYGDVVPGWFELYVTLESTASRIRVFDPLLVPGPLQVREYMDAAIRADRPELTGEQVTTRIDLKLSRQQILTRSFPQPPRLDVIINEAVLLAELPTRVMRAQIWHLLKATDLPTVTVRAVPQECGPHRASVCGAFTLLDFPAENGTTPPSTVYSEMLTGAIYLDKPSEVDAHAEVWAALDSVVLSQAETIGLLATRLKELNEREG